MPDPVRTRRPSRVHSASWGSMVARWNLQALGEFSTGPSSRGLTAHDRHDLMSAGVGFGLPGLARITARFLPTRVERWCMDGDVDGGDGGRVNGSAVFAVEVAGGGALDPSGAVAASPLG